MTKHLFVAASIVALTLVGYFHFPGHTYPYADTQIYIPILEHYWDPTVLDNDLLAQNPHVSFTVYDEVTLALRQIPGFGLQEALTAQQLIFRALGIFGVFLIATSLNLSTRMALLVAGVFSLGATIGGPTVLTFEYEPIPRGFAVPLLFLALGFAAHGRDLAAGIAASISFLYQAPAGYTFWAVYFCLTLWPNRPAVMSRRILGLLPLLLAVILMLFLSRLQPGVTEPQVFFNRIDPALEKLQRMRAPYNWVSMWNTYWFWHYSFLYLVSLFAFLRLRKSVFQDLKFFLIGLPLLGLLSLPGSYIALERFKWVLMPQVQPMRAVLFITALAGILASVAGVRAAQSRRHPESILWFALAFAIPAHPQVPRILAFNLGDPLIRERLLIVLLLAALAALAAWGTETRRRWSLAALALAVAAPFFLIPKYGKVVNYTRLDSPQLAELSDWARSSTPKDAVFLFPDAGRHVYPGIFRAGALRTVYVDWKMGGQANFFENLALEWWRRWQETMAGKITPSDMKRYSSLGINYVVVQPKNRLPNEDSIFSNPAFLVYQVTR